MTATRFSNTARYWRSPLLPDADMLTAEYYDHEFTPHWHDAYTIPVIEEGAECYDYRGSKYVAEAGSVPIINPGELHTGARAVDVGWRYRVFYLPVDFVQSVADEIAGRAQPMPWFPADIVRDADVARRVQRAHQALEAGGDPLGGDPLAAEHALFDAVSTLLVRHAGQRPPVGRVRLDTARVESMKSRLADDMTVPL